MTTTQPSAPILKKDKPETLVTPIYSEQSFSLRNLVLDGYSRLPDVTQGHLITRVYYTVMADKYEDEYKCKIYQFNEIQMANFAREIGVIE